MLRAFGRVCDGTGEDKKIRRKMASRRACKAAEKD